MLTFVLAVIGWVIFRAETMSDAVLYLSSMADISFFDIDSNMPYLKGLNLTRLFVMLLLLVMVEWVQRTKQHALEFIEGGYMSRHKNTRTTLYLVMIMIIICLKGTQSEFIYFQF